MREMTFASSQQEVAVFEKPVPGPGSAEEPVGGGGRASSPSLLLFSLELSDTEVYEPEIRALLGTAAYSFKVVVLRNSGGV